MHSKRYCNTCANQGAFQDGSPGCAKFKIKINPEKDFCSWHSANNFPICTFCQEQEGLVLIKLNDSWHYICQNHFSILYTCQTCEYNPICNFRNDSTEQQYVIQQVRQGNMILQQQVKNPNMVSRHCSTCHCSFGNEYDCFKESCANESGCPNWQLRKELLQ